MNTPLQNGLGHIYGPGRTASTEGMFPVWLEQDGSRIMGGIIDLQFEYKSGLKVVDIYPESIRTATPCYKKEVGAYVPIPTYRILSDVTSESTTVEIAHWEGVALLKKNMVLVNPSDTSKTITIGTISNTSDGNYQIAIDAGAIGVMKAGDCLILSEASSWDVEGLTKTNLMYVGADPKSKLNITLIDRGRLLSEVAPALPKVLKEKLQTVKYE